MPTDMLEVLSEGKMEVGCGVAKKLPKKTHLVKIVVLKFLNAAIINCKTNNLIGSFP